MHKTGSAIWLIPAGKMSFINFIAAIFQFPYTNWGIFLYKANGLTIIRELVLKEPFLVPVLPHAFDFIPSLQCELAKPMGPLFSIGLPLELPFITVCIYPFNLVAFLQNSSPFRR